MEEYGRYRYPPSLYFSLYGPCPTHIPLPFIAEFDQDQEGIGGGGDAGRSGGGGEGHQVRNEPRGVLLNKSGAPQRGHQLFRTSIREEDTTCRISEAWIRILMKQHLFLRYGSAPNVLDLDANKAAFFSGMDLH